VLAEPKVTAGNFSSGSLEGWRHERIEGETQYTFVEVDGRRVLRAHCEGGASSLVWERTVDLAQTPVLHWSWRVERVYEDVDERTRSGNDYPARLWVVFDGGILKWRTRAINYVWASNEPRGSAWPHPFFEKRAVMKALRSGPPEEARSWRTETRDVRSDFRRLLDLDTDRIHALGLMTDCDNSGQTGTAYYGNIFFTSKGPAP